MSSDLTPKQAPAIVVPKSDSTCTLSIIDTTCSIVAPPNFLVEPEISGHNWLNLPDYAFHIKHEASGAELIFDLGTRPDWDNAVPQIKELVGEHVPGVKVDKGVPEILTNGGVKLDDVKALILSHWHFDHSGNLSALPPCVDLIVGPGFKDAFLPGYPSHDKSPFWESDFKGRNVIEAPFDTSIGKFRAWDYFGDGSIYVLNVPGHTTGHISALVRTTPDTFVFLGGDVCHFTGDIRPTEYMPLPDPIPAKAMLDKRIPVPCPCSIFTACHPRKDAARTTPFYTCASGPASFYDDVPTARESIRTLTEFDADPNILIIIAHDVAPIEVIPTWFPKGNINDWKAKGYKEVMHWHFLNELPIDGKTGRETRIDGLYLNGKRLKNLQGEKV